MQFWPLEMGGVISRLLPFPTAPRRLSGIIRLMEFKSIRELEELPLFPLATVLFPGAILPLHIFEDRYKAMMRHALENDRLFGLSYRKDAEAGAETPPDIGSIGCAARIETVMPLEEDKMDLICTGVIRYRVVGLNQLSPFLLARVEPFMDDPEPDNDLTELFDDLRDIGKQFLMAAEVLNELGVPINPNLPEDPEAFSLLLSSALPFDNDRKQRLLEMTSTKLRLTRLKSYVTSALAVYTERLKIQQQAKGNGHGRPVGQ